MLGKDDDFKGVLVSAAAILGGILVFPSACGDRFGACRESRTCPLEVGGDSEGGAATESPSAGGGDVPATGGSAAGASHGSESGDAGGAGEGGGFRRSTTTLTRGHTLESRPTMGSFGAIRSPTPARSPCSRLMAEARRASSDWPQATAPSKLRTLSYSKTEYWLRLRTPPPNLRRAGVMCPCRWGARLDRTNWYTRCSSTIAFWGRPTSLGSRLISRRSSANSPNPK
jgi:hypothetical protein